MLAPMATLFMPLMAEVLFMQAVGQTVFTAVQVMMSLKSGVVMQLLTETVALILSLCMATMVTIKLPALLLAMRL